jgi:hypothetical protein
MKLTPLAEAIGQHVLASGDHAAFLASLREAA